MPIDDDNIKIDIGVLKSQVATLTSLCGKMDTIIEKLVDQHDRHIAKVYIDMESRRRETDADIKEIHDRIDVVLDKMQASELRIMDEIKNLRGIIQNHQTSERKQLDAILQWKWFITGGVLVLSWLLSHVNADIITKLIR
jgi:Mg2+ and Co2+ transporter CorA